MPDGKKKPSPEKNGTRYVLAIDLGSGGPKAGIISDSGRVMSSASVKVPVELLPSGGAEQCPSAWWSGVKSAVKKAIASSGVPRSMIDAVSCDSQFFVVVPVDTAGEPLMNAIHWLDSRGAPYNRRIIRGIINIEGYGCTKLARWIRLTGIAPSKSGIDSIGHIHFLKNERPDIFNKTWKFLEPMDYINLRLSGKCAASQETMFPFAVVDNRTWGTTEYSRSLLSLAGLPRDKLPDLVPNKEFIGTVLPAVAQELGLPPSARVIAGTNDTNASAIGSGAVDDYDGVIYIGTSLVLTCHVPYKKTDIFHAMTTMPSPLMNRYLLFGEQGTGGKALEYFLNAIVYARDEFGTAAPPEDVYHRVDRLAASVPPGSGGVIFMPWLNGTITPEENGDVRGGFFNLSLGSTRAHMTRAVLESLAYNNRWTREVAEKFTGRAFHRFRFAGGGALSDIWAQIHADVLGVPIHQVEDPARTTLRGAAMLAFNRLGHRSVREISSLITIKKVFRPDPANRAVYDRMYRQYRELFRRNKPIFNTLNAR